MILNHNILFILGNKDIDLNYFFEDMTTIAGSLQPNLARHLPTIIPLESNINQVSVRGETSNQPKLVVSKSNDTLNGIHQDENSASVKDTKIMGTKFQTMSSSPSVPSIDPSSNLFLSSSSSSSSQLMGYMPQCEAVSRNAQVRVPRFIIFLIF